ncbi:MAG: thiamine-phosphate kinase [Candidatus Omnitrophica bacterium]|nr:thiamine-phosphate kinase [Candidatus Omnitrophota bacterium]
MTKLSHLGEFGLIETLKKFQNLLPRVVKGIGDDAAVLKVKGGRYLLFTTDMLVEDVHFLRRMPAKAVGHKALACNLSDVAAMGGEPVFAVVSLGVPGDISAKYVKDLYTGMWEVAKEFGVSIVGGDTVRSEKVVVNIALLGEVEKRRLIRRQGARPGDWIFVSGALGGSLKSGRHLKFTPRVKEARFLAAKFKPSAMMDLSDGLAGDLAHILKASCVGALIEEKLIPCHRGVSPARAMTDGEDFELLFTMPATRAKKLLEYEGDDKLCFYPIGVVRPRREGFRIVRPSGRIDVVETKGYRHF